MVKRGDPIKAAIGVINDIKSALIDMYFDNSTGIVIIWPGAQPHNTLEQCVLYNNYDLDNIEKLYKISCFFKHFIFKFIAYFDEAHEYVIVWEDNTRPLNGIATSLCNPVCNIKDYIHGTAIIFSLQDMYEVSLCETFLMKLQWMNIYHYKNISTYKELDYL